MGFPIVWIYWIISLTIVTYASACIVKKFKQQGFAALVAFYTIYLGASQILAARIVKFDLGFYSFFAPAAVFIYPFIAQAIDMINEVYEEKSTPSDRCSFCHASFIGCIYSIVFSPAPFFKFEEAWKNIFNLGIRITAASWIAFLVCQNLDAFVFAWLKRKYERRVLLRSVTSDVLDLTLDSLIFVTIAFYRVMPIVPLIIGQIVSKNIIGFLDTPLVCLV